LLDEGVPDSVADVLRQWGHVPILHREVLLGGEKDEVVCATALANGAILVAIDADMKRMAKRYGITPKNEDRFARLSVIRLCCNEVLASKRLDQAMTIVEHEWTYTKEKAARRMWIDVGAHLITTHR
jgi:hypothetical protein